VNASRTDGRRRAAEASPLRGSARGSRAAPVALVVALALGACATPPAPDETIVVPEGARRVDRISSLTASPDRWTILNTHIVLVSNIGADYLIVFDESCRGLARVGATIGYRRGNDLDVGTILRVGEHGCGIDHIYGITRPDAVALRERFGD
jgi:hypothetical protein